MERFVVDHAGKLAVAVMASGVALYNITEYLSPTVVVDSPSSTSLHGRPAYGSQSSSIGKDVSDSNTRPAMTMEQARLRAMIENAQQSTWQQNLDNAFVAQEKFMLGNERGEKSPEFVRKIEARTKELMQQAELQRQKDLEKEKKRKITTKIW